VRRNNCHVTSPLDSNYPRLMPIREVEYHRDLTNPLRMTAAGRVDLVLSHAQARLGTIRPNLGIQGDD
jgi:hypothetical protein